MKFAILALTLLLAVASQAASVPGEEPSLMLERYTFFKSMVAQLKTVLDSAMASTPDAQEHLQTPSVLSQGLGAFHAMLESNQDAFLASVSAGQDIVSQMTGAEELGGELRAALNNLDGVLRGHMNEYSSLLLPIVQKFKHASLQFREVAAPNIQNLRNEFRTNLEETVSALGPIARTLLRMASNLRESVSMYADEYRRNMEEFYKVIENLSPEEKERRKAEMELIGQEIVAKIQKLYEVASGVQAAS